MLRNMSGVQQDGDMTAESFSLNASAALGLHDQETKAAEFGRFYGSFSFKTGCIDVCQSLICLPG